MTEERLLDKYIELRGFDCFDKKQRQLVSNTYGFHCYCANYYGKQLLNEMYESNSIFKRILVWLNNLINK